MAEKCSCFRPEGEPWVQGKIISPRCESHGYLIDWEPTSEQNPD